MVLAVFPIVLMALSLLVPVLPWAVFVHGRLTDLYYIATFCAAAFFSVRSVTAQSWESRYTPVVCTVFGAGLLANLLFSNRFEPIRFFWQFEWCGLFLVLLFGAMMVSRSRRILKENDMLTNHLEEQVKERTEEVTQLLNERKAFFSDMAHDLKAPVFATQSFIEAIRRSGVGVDTELQNYLNQAEAKQWEMARRLQGLSTINALDRIDGERVRVSVREMLSEVYATHCGEAEVRSVYLIVEPPEQDAFLMAQPEKLNILFENLIYNALKATPRNGSITVSAKTEEGKIRVILEDTGCGIPKEELPLVFRRFYVGVK
ncbi:MAG: HAMP domain-containing histidine kinase, partial [Oscillospiraceae bacterium]|nr:HAMP domain-containing histidine kinase [Oscillospiraceae bacterium]